MSPEQHLSLPEPMLRRCLLRLEHAAANHDATLWLTASKPLADQLIHKHVVGEVCEWSARFYPKPEAYQRIVLWFVFEAMTAPELGLAQVCRSLTPSTELWLFGWNHRSALPKVLRPLAMRRAEHGLGDHGLEEAQRWMAGLDMNLRQAMVHEYHWRSVSLLPGRIDRACHRWLPFWALCYTLCYVRL